MGSLKLPHASGNSMSIAAPATNPASDLELKLPATIGTAGQVLKNSSTAGTLEFGDAGGASGTYGNATSVGTGNTFSITLGSSTKFKILFENITADADANIWFRLGDSGGVENSGYMGFMGHHLQNSVNTGLEDHAFNMLNADPNSKGHYGQFNLVNYSGNIWYADAHFWAGNSSYDNWTIHGRKETSGTLTTLQVLLQNAANWTGGHYRLITY
jgi:hypothetical protein